MQEFIIVFFVCFWSIVVAIVARQVLGVPVGWPRALIVGLVTILTGSPILNFIVDRSGLIKNGKVMVTPGIASLFVILTFAWVFALGLTSLVIAEAIAPTGTLPSPLSLITGWKARRRRTKRYLQIITIATRNGLGGFLGGRVRTGPDRGPAQIARSLRRALNEAGVTFVKLGQMISTRRDLVPDEFIVELSTLQTRAEPVPWSRIEPAIVATLGRPIQEVFSLIDPEPLASASVAQVHEAQLLDGSDVVVKVQRPGARQQVTSDLEIILRLARWLNRVTPWGRSLGVYRLAQGFAASMDEELDYTVEIDNMRSIAAGLAADPQSRIRIPRVYPEYSSSALLVMDKVDGTPVGDAGALLQTFTPDERREIAAQLLKEVLRQIVVTGVFHADLHPGNVLLQADHGLALLDFGSVGRLDEAARTALGLLLLAIDRNDSIGATDALIELLDRPDELTERELEREIGQLLLRYRSGFGASGSAGMFTSLFKVIRGHGFAIPPQIAAAFRALAALEGTLAIISADLDFVATAREEGRAMMGALLRPGMLRQTLEGQLISLYPVLQRLPRRLNRISDDLEQGRLSINIRPLADRRDRAFITDLIHQIIVAALACAATLGAVILLTSNTGPMIAPDFRLYAFLGYTLLFVGFILGLRSLIRVFKRPQHDISGENLR